MSPRYSTGAYGFGSQLSWWASPARQEDMNDRLGLRFLTLAVDRGGRLGGLHPEVLIEGQADPAEEADVHERAAGERRSDARTG